MYIRERQAMETKQRLIRTAERLIGLYGYENVSVDQIVAECGIAKGTFYHHFKSKDELMARICSSIYDGLRDEVDDLGCTGGIEKLRGFITLWHQKVSTFNLHFARQIQSAQGQRLSQLEQGIALLHEYLTEAVARSELAKDTPVDTLAKALMFAMQGSTIYHYKNESDFDVPEWNREFQKHILTPLLAPYLTA